jgi:hypothetical protein
VSSRDGAVAESRPGRVRGTASAAAARTRYPLRLASRRTGSIAAIVVLSVFAGVALYWARDTDQYMGNLLLNVGACFAGAVITYALVNPLMTRTEVKAEKILDHLDHNSIIEHIYESTGIVRIFEQRFRESWYAPHT